MAKWKWLTSSNDSFNVDENGNEIFEYNNHNVLFEYGKIVKINKYKRAKKL